MTAVVEPPNVAAMPQPASSRRRRTLNLRAERLVGLTIVVVLALAFIRTSFASTWDMVS